MPERRAWPPLRGRPGERLFFCAYPIDTLRPGGRFPWVCALRGGGMDTFVVDGIPLFCFNGFAFYAYRIISMKPVMLSETGCCCHVFARWRGMSETSDVASNCGPGGRRRSTSVQVEKEDGLVRKAADAACGGGDRGGIAAQDRAGAAGYPGNERWYS